ncbi:uracil phosphoribosyltransferase [Brasilonema bromeliae]|uniref:Uracil phosphoribosyltransferase n=1 Tax=Brasilonema bromeliae SPC951 TaxID=385972 RepID=A0ABX1PED0_9CYAN|nr:uracil phosphoribosyltransferase [Brasilonema bromeliae]NMG22701.1 uracil phosphoribosyltransferase [Brasilonema bromeliae SPC951]
MHSQVKVIEHPLIQHKLTLMRKAETTTTTFRVLLKEISLLLTYEITRDFPVKYEQIKTPLAPMNAPVIALDKKLVIVSIQRAGQGILDGILELIPSATVGHIGLYRDPKTLIPVEYYFKVPQDIDQRDVIVVDPMLATGNSAVAAVERVKSTNPMSIKFLCILAAPEGIEHFTEVHPDIPLYTTAIDDHLDENGYIIPGLGDAGDRLFGTI